MSRTAGLRRRLLQVGFVVGATLAVLVADGAAEGLLEASAGVGPRRVAALLVVGGRVLAGWALGMAFRLQLAPSAAPDRGLRLLVGVPVCVLASWPLLATFVPAGLAARLPAWVSGGALVQAAPFLGIVLGLVLALGVTGRGR